MTIFWVFGMTQPGIEPQSFGPLANTIFRFKWITKPLVNEQEKIINPQVDLAISADHKLSIK